MRLLNLFDGIGGFALAAEMMGYPLDWLVSPFQGGGGKPSNASATR